jgi:cutinase
MSADQTIRASLVQSVASQCPSTKVVMSGYSQGGQLVHNAAKLLPAATMAGVSSVVIFGDPGKSYTSRGSKQFADIQQ